MINSAKLVVAIAMALSLIFFVLNDVYLIAKELF